MRYLNLGAVLLLVAAAGCARESDTADTVAMADTAAAAPAVAPVDARAGEAARVTKAMEANPAAADSILAAAGYTRDSFQQLMYDIAADSAASASYEAAKTAP